MNPKFLYTLLFVSIFSITLPGQTGSWQLWASGLQQGSYPKMTVAPNHDIFYALVGTGGKKGVVYKANTKSPNGIFSAMDSIPYPTSLVNNIECLTTNQNSEPIVGIFRNNILEPWLFRFDNTTQKWVTATTNLSPSLGAYSITRSSNGTIWVGAKWSYIYKSTDNGNSYTQIIESNSALQNYPCHFPSWFNYNLDGAIYGINVDNNGRVYAGTESAGILYSDDEGVSWRPADVHPCQDIDPTLKDSSSAMKALGLSGNVAALGFTADNNLVWSGAAMWTLNWKNTIGFADMTNNTVSSAIGFPDYLVTTGQQVSKIVTASNGQMFLHSGGGTNSTGIGIYTSMDGINWTVFNTGIAGINDGQTQGSLAVDSNMVFMATHDGKVFRYMVEDIKTDIKALPEQNSFVINPNPANNTIKIKLPSLNSDFSITICNSLGNIVKQYHLNIDEIVREITLDISSIQKGIYFVSLTSNGKTFIEKLVVEE